MRIGRTDTDSPYRIDDLARSILFCGESQQGKTVCAFRLLRALAQTGAAITIIDGAGTLTDLLLGWQQDRRLLARIAGTPLPDPIRVLDLTTVPTGGAGFDLLRLVPGETVLERAAAVVGTLNVQRADNVLFNVVHEIAPAAIAALTAAHRPITDLMTLLRHEPPPRYLASLVEAIVHHGHLGDPDGVQLAERLARILPLQLTVGTAALATPGLHRQARRTFEDEVASTRRMFRWCLDTPHLFTGGPYTMATFTAPGITCIRGVHADPRLTGLQRAAFAGLWASAVLARGKDADPHACLVIDEKEGIDFSLLADQICRAANAHAAIWLLCQDAEQLGDARVPLLAAMHRLLLFRQRSTAVVGYAARVLNRARVDAQYLATEVHAEGEHEDEGGSTSGSRTQVFDPLTPTWEPVDETVYEAGRAATPQEIRRTGSRYRVPHATPDHYQEAEGSSWKKGRSRTITRGQERISLPEQLAALEQDIISLQPQTVVSVAAQHAAIVHLDTILLPPPPPRVVPTPPKPPAITIAYLPEPTKDKTPPAVASVPPTASQDAPSDTPPVKPNGKPVGRGSRPRTPLDRSTPEKGRQT